MSVTPRARRLAGGGYVLTTFGAYPHPVGDGVVDLGLVLGWIAPGMLLLAIRGLPPAKAAKAAFERKPSACTAG